MMIKIMTCEDFVTRFNRADRFEEITYHTGDLALDRSRYPEFEASTRRLCSVIRLGMTNECLVFYQRRVAPMCFDYVVKKLRPWPKEKMLEYAKTLDTGKYISASEHSWMIRRIWKDWR